MIIITQFKNEEKRLKEWIEHHHWLGFKKFILYDDNSTDNSFQEIKNLQNSGIDIELYSVMSTDHRLHIRILDSVNRGLEITQNYSKELPILITEVDEFLVSGKNTFNKNIYQLLQEKFLKTSYELYYIPSYDIKPTYDLTKSNICLQETKRWSEKDRKTKQNGIWKERGKSLTTNKRCPQIFNIHVLHDFDKVNGIGHVYNKTLLANEWDLRLHHFRLPPNGYENDMGSGEYFNQFDEDDYTLYNMNRERLHEKFTY